MIPRRKIIPVIILAGGGLGALENEPLLTRIGPFFLPVLLVTAAVVWLMARVVRRTLARMMAESGKPGEESRARP